MEINQRFMILFSDKESLQDSIIPKPICMYEGEYDEKSNSYHNYDFVDI